MSDYSAYVPNVHFELIQFKNLVSNQDYQRSLSEGQVALTAHNFDVFSSQALQNTGEKSGECLLLVGVSFAPYTFITHFS